MNTYLAIDIGASNGRHIIGYIDEASRLAIREIYRFPNGAVKKDGRLIWDVDALFKHVLEGIRIAGELGFKPKSIGIDTWGVDFALVDREGRRLDDIVAYRDSRTQGMPEHIEGILPTAELYARTGTQRQIFNTIYQLAAVKEETPELLEQAEHLLLMPDYLNFLLTGAPATEFTMATTTGLLNIRTQDWDWELLDQLGFPRHLFKKPSKAGQTAGRLKPELAEKVGFEADVIHVASHDTGSAYLGAPLVGKDSVVLSSGTWSLLGIELEQPVLTEEAMEANFTNEGCYDGSIRFLKNIMGLWMIQSIRKENPKEYSYGELATLAQASDYDGIVDVNDDAFFAPANMREAVAAACETAGYPRPEALSDVLRCVYRSLALSYKESIEQLERITGKRFKQIHIVGGGSQNELLNRWTAECSGLDVYAGPVEATVIGNLAVQLMADGYVSDAAEVRTVIRSSFPIERYETK